MFSRDVIRIDASETSERIEKTIREQVLGTLRRRGAVVGIGFDATVASKYAKEKRRGFLSYFKVKLLCS